MEDAAGPGRHIGDPDVVLVGSGINALVCGAILARAGVGVAVLEQAGELGGAIRTAELTVPGFHHDVFSAWHPLFVTSEAYAVLREELAAGGLHYACAPTVSASVTSRGHSWVMTTSPEQNAAELDRDGSGDGGRYLSDRASFERVAPLTMTLLGDETVSSASARAAWSVLRRNGRHRALGMLGSLTENARTWLLRTYRSAGAPTLFSPWLLHTGLGPEAAASGIMNRAIVALIEQAGLPVPVGGSASLVRALQAIIEANGGVCRTRAEVDRVLVRHDRAVGVRLTDGEYIGARRAVVCSVTPPALYGRLLADAPVPEWARSAAGRFRFGRAGMQLHFALSSAPRWVVDERLADAPLIHLTTGLDAVSRAVGEADRGLLPANATIVCGQPCVVDASRAPTGRSILWVQLQELPSRPAGDAAGKIDVGDGTWTSSLRERYADRIQSRLAEHIDGFESSVIGRAVLSPADIERANPNLVGGDIYAGSCDLDQGIFFRPRPELRGHTTPLRGLYQIGASTHPGPGLGAVSGTLVAKRLLRAGRHRR